MGPNRLRAAYESSETAVSKVFPQSASSFSVARGSARVVPFVRIASGRPASRASTATGSGIDHQARSRPRDRIRRLQCGLCSGHALARHVSRRRTPRRVSATLARIANAAVEAARGRSRRGRRRHGCNRPSTVVRQRDCARPTGPARLREVRAPQHRQRTASMRRGDRARRACRRVGAGRDVLRHERR